MKFIETKHGAFVDFRRICFVWAQDITLDTSEICVSLNQDKKTWVTWFDFERFCDHESILDQQNLLISIALQYCDDYEHGAVIRLDEIKEFVYAEAKELQHTLKIRSPV